MGVGGGGMSFPSCVMRSLWATLEAGDGGMYLSKSVMRASWGILRVNGGGISFSEYVTRSIWGTLGVIDGGMYSSARQRYKERHTDKTNCKKKKPLQKEKMTS